MAYSTNQNAPGSSLGAGSQPATIASGNGYFNFNCGSELDFAGVEAQIVVNDQASADVDENLTFNATLTADEIAGAFKYKQKGANTVDGAADANEITLDLSAGYAAFKTALWNQLKENANGDNGVATCQSLGDYVVGLVAWSTFGNYKAVAPIVNDQELTTHVDGAQATVADKVALAMVTHASGSLEGGSHSFLKGDISNCPLGDVLTTMIKYHPDRFQINDVSDYQAVPFRTGDIIEFTVTLENLKVVENVDTSVAYLKAAKTLPYGAEIDTDGYLNGGVHPSPDHKWVVGVKITLQ